MKYSQQVHPIALSHLYCMTTFLLTSLNLQKVWKVLILQPMTDYHGVFLIVSVGMYFSSMIYTTLNYYDSFFTYREYGISFHVAISCQLMPCWIFQQSQPLTTGARFGFDWSNDVTCYEEIVCLSSSRSVTIWFTT